MVWKAVAGLFYGELVVCLVLIFPLLSARRWKRILGSHLVATIWSYIRFYVGLFAVSLVVLSFGAAREMYKQQLKKKQAPAEEEGIVLEKMFRAQRNFFITLSSTIMMLILLRVGSLIISQAKIEEDLDETLGLLRMEADAVTRASLETKEKEDKAVQSELYSTKEKINELLKELSNVEKDKEMMSAGLEQSKVELENLSQNYSNLRMLADGHSLGKTAFP